jgi:hypothetical protein
MHLNLKSPGIGRASCLFAALALSGCTLNPLMAPSSPRPASVTPSAPVVGTAPADMSAGVSASAAEQACMGAGRERNLDVVGVVGSSSATGADGAPSRDVMLRVRRNGSEIEVRCNYASSTGLARIMLI